MTNPLDLFSEFDALNGGGTPINGTWYLTSHPSGAPTLGLCISCDGGSSWNTVALTVGGPGVGTPICSLGYHTPLIDINGDVGACAPLAYPDGAYEFTYKPPNGACESLTATLTANLYTLAISLSRDDTACMYEAYAENPIDSSDNIPDITMPPGYITPYFEFNVNVDKRSLLNCTSLGTIQSTLDNVGVSQVEFAAGTGISGPTLSHRIETPSNAIFPNGYIETLRLGVSGDINLSAFVRGVGESIFVFINRLTNDPGGLKDQLDASVGAYMYNVQVGSNGADGVRFTFTCANVVGWEGIDKTDGFLSWCQSGGCPPSSGSTTTVTQIVSGDFIASYPTLYTTPCGDPLFVKVEACPGNAELGIYDVAASNYNSLVLQNVSGRRYYVTDLAAEGFYRQAVCHDVEVTINSSGCPAPISPVVYDWSSGSTDNPKLFDPLEQDDAQVDCDGCMISESFCYPEAGFAGHGVGESITCNSASPIEHLVSLGSVVTSCSGNPITMVQLQSVDVPAAFTSSVPDAGTQRITNTLPADVLPRTYYVAYRYRDPVEGWSNFELVRTHVAKGDCCA